MSIPATARSYEPSSNRDLFTHVGQACRRNGLARWVVVSVSLGSGETVMGEQMQTDLLIEDDGSARLVVRGEIDVSVAHELAAAVDKACSAEPSKLFVDVAAVSFCDSSGIAQFVRAVQICDTSGTACHIVRPSPIVRRVFDACGLGDILER
jgi:anti-anti-sigma factor